MIGSARRHQNALHTQTDSAVLPRGISRDVWRSKAAFRESSKDEVGSPPREQNPSQTPSFHCLRRTPYPHWLHDVQWPGLAIDCQCKLWVRGLVADSGPFHGELHGHCFQCKRREESHDAKLAPVEDGRIGRVAAGHDYSCITIPGTSCSQVFRGDCQLAG